MKSIYRPLLLLTSSIVGTLHGALLPPSDVDPPHMAGGPLVEILPPGPIPASIPREEIDKVDNASLTVHIDLYTDFYADEISWTLVDQDGELVEEFIGDFDTPADSLVPTAVNLTQGAKYRFNIEDRGNNGICCGTSGNGRVDIYGIPQSGEKIPIVTFDGIFSDDYFLDFTVPIVEIKDCSDSFGLFEASFDVGNRDCIWLSANLARFEYLCRFVAVAFACKTTCDTCSYFA